MKSNSEHWNSIFSQEHSTLGWYEKDLTPTFTLLNQIETWKSSTIFIPGAGTSTLVDTLLLENTKLVLNDISIIALNNLKERLGKQNIDWLCQNIAQPIQKEIPIIDIWIDRAVLHFLIEEENINGYFDNLKSHLRIGGYAIFAEFSKKGATKCAGLTIHQYSTEELSKKLGTSFSLISSFEHVYINPNGDPRPYIYVLFKREE
ncbi:MAG TPA: methyltransferase type 12 [Thioploca sp.]|nr:methyltransferase type 12 [Thioploca sp.]